MSKRIEYYHLESKNRINTNFSQRRKMFDFSSFAIDEVNTSSLEFLEDINCTCGTGITQLREIHLRIIEGNRAEVRLYTRRSNRATTFDGVITGPTTGGRIQCQRYAIINKTKLSPHGLIYFANFHGNYGFHSNHQRTLNIDPNVDARYIATRIPGRFSAGCARMNDSEAPQLSSRGQPDDRANRNLDSFQFYNAIRLNDIVRVYKREHGWLRPSWNRVCRDA